MEFATTIIARDLAAIGPYARLSEDLGFATLGLGDSPAVSLDPFLCMADAARATSTLRLGVTVLNPRTRHPLVIANSCLTLDLMAPGRIYLGIATGNSGVRQAGLDPVSIAELREASVALQALHSGKRAELNGTSMSLGMQAATIPLMIAGSGPQSLRLAGAVADWVLINVGTDPRAVAQALSDVRVGALAAGRDPASLEIWLFAIAYVDQDDRFAAEQVKSGVAGVAAYLLPSAIVKAYIPNELKAATGELIARYDYSEHFTPGHSANAELVDKLAIGDFLVDRFAFAGTAGSLQRRIAELRSVGIERFWFSLSGAKNPDVQLRRLAESLGDA